MDISLAADVSLIYPATCGVRTTFDHFDAPLFVFTESDSGQCCKQQLNPPCLSHAKDFAAVKDSPLAAFE